MYFDLDDEQKAIRETVSSFLADNLDNRRALELSDAGVLDPALWSGISGLGVNGIMVPEGAEGLDMGLLTLAVVAEELGRAAAPLPVVQNALAAWLIGQHGSAAQRDKWLEGLVSGDVVAAFALGEGEGHLEPVEWTLVPHKANGCKTAVEWARHASLFIAGLAGGGLGLVSANALGVSIASAGALDRTRPLASVTFNDAVIELLTDELAIAQQLVQAFYILLAADAYGSASRALALAVDYAKERVQFGQPIGAFQGIKHQLANMTVDVEPSRALYWYAAHAWDAIPTDVAHAASLAKVHIGNLAVKTVRLAVEVHGGIGYTWEYPLHLWLKRAMYDRTAFGGPIFHNAQLARELHWEVPSGRESNA